MKPFGWHVVDRNGNRTRNGFTYEESADLVILADADWPANAPHRTIPLYTHPAGMAEDAERLREAIDALDRYTMIVRKGSEGAWMLKSPDGGYLFKNDVDRLFARRALTGEGK